MSMMVFVGTEPITLSDQYGSTEYTPYTGSASPRFFIDSKHEFVRRYPHLFGKATPGQRARGRSRDCIRVGVTTRDGVHVSGAPLTLGRAAARAARSRRARPRCRERASA